MAERDILDGFYTEDILLEDDLEGELKSVLVYKKCPGESKKAVLYVHGFVDYFFQEHLAARFIEKGYNFYALDLHKYGRSLMDHQTPNFCFALSDYFEELDKAVAVIYEREKNEQLILHAHSTGGLICSLYAHHRRDKNTINALVLNSPWFDMNINWFERYMSMPISIFLGTFFPFLVLPKKMDPNYCASIHKDFYIEEKKKLGVYEKDCWSFNLKWKPINGFAITAGFIRAIRKGQKELHKGLSVKCPVLLLHSDKRGKEKKQLVKYYFSSDCVLNPAHMTKWISKAGKAVNSICISGGIHDLALSGGPVRQKYFQSMFNWLSEQDFS